MHPVNEAYFPDVAGQLAIVRELLKMGRGRYFETVLAIGVQRKLKITKTSAEPAKVDAALEQLEQNRRQLETEMNYLIDEEKRLSSLESAESTPDVPSLLSSPSSDSSPRPFITPLRGNGPHSPPGS